MAWIYNAGQRRVRRAPQIAYDGPYPASEGQRVADNLDMFNGAPDRYDWKLVGKRELYIPTTPSAWNRRSCSTPMWSSRGTSTPTSPATNCTASGWWRRRSPGERHVYAKRVMYLDEDSWQIVLADHFDARNTLWRVAEGFMTPLYDKRIPGSAWRRCTT